MEAYPTYPTKLLYDNIISICVLFGQIYAFKKQDAKI